MGAPPATVSTADPWHHPFASPSFTFPGANAPDASIDNGLRNPAGTNATPGANVPPITGILSDPQFRMIIQAIQQHTGADILSMPRIATESGRQAHVAMSADIGAVANLGTNMTTPFGEGPSLDVVPTVTADGYGIQLVLKATMREFLGYEKPAPMGIQSNAVSSPQPVPRFRNFSAASTVNVWDGQTVLLGGTMPGSDASQQHSTNSQRANLMVFITVRLIDPAGNPVHAGEYMPFATESIPPQGPGNGVPK